MTQAVPLARVPGNILISRLINKGANFVSNFIRLIMVFGVQRILVWHIREAKPILHFQNG